MKNKEIEDYRIPENIGKPIPAEDEIFSTKRLRGVVKNDRIYLDRKGLYDKPQKCPISIPIPQTPDEIKYFIESLEWLFSKEGYISSKKYESKDWRIVEDVSK